MLKNHRVHRFVAILFAVLVISASAYGQRFGASLDQAQEVPPSGSAGVGYGSVVLSADQTQITVNLGFTGLGTAASAAHIHTGAVGVNGPVTFGLAGVPAAPSGVIAQQTFAITPAQVVDLLAGNMYFNIHSAGFPGGEIRGQILAPSCTTAMAVEVHATAATMGPTGYGTLSAAIAAINAGTHQGAIDVEVCTNVTETAAMFLNSNAAAPASYTSVNIYPLADGLTISGPTILGRGLIELNGADSVTIDGDNPNSAGTNRNLTITNTAAVTVNLTSVIRIAVIAAVPTADNNTFRNLNINGSAVARNVAGLTSTTNSENSSFGIYAGGLATGATTAPAPLTSVSTNTAAAGTTINAFNATNNAVNACARGIFFNGAAATVSTGVTISNNLVGDQVVNNVGIPPYTTPTTTVYTKPIFVAGTTALTIANNSIRNIISYVSTATNGIELNSAIGAGGVTITGNTINTVATNAGSATNGITHTQTLGTYNISSNIISNISSATSSSNGILVSGTATSGTVSNNRITNIKQRSGGFRANGITVSSGNAVTIQNNFISDVMNTGSASFGTSFNANGIGLIGGINHRVYHNSVNLFGVSPSTGSNSINCLAITASTQTGIDVRNNIFSNTVTGGAATDAHVAVFLPFAASASMLLTLNNNAYYTGTIAARSGVAFAGATTYAAANVFTAANFDPTMTTPATNFRSFSSALGVATNDNASFATVAAAPFTSTTDLHIPAATVTLLESGGAAVGLLTDIDGDVRPNGVAPDIGADEFAGIAPPANDIAATAFVVPTNGAQILNGSTTTPQASFTNVGIATQINISVQFTISGPGSYSYMNTQVIATLAPSATTTVTFLAAPAYTMAGAYTMSAAVITPDSNAANDTIAGGFTVADPLSGPYTVGSGGNYPSLTNNGGIFEAINSLGATGNITIEILSNLSGETGTHALNEIAGGFSTLMYPCDNPITITGSNATALIRLNGADNVTIDGDSNLCSPPAVVGGTPASRHLTIENTSPSTASAVIAIQSGANGAQNNTIANVNVDGNAPTTTLVGIHNGGMVIGALGTDNDGNDIINCRVRRAQFGIFSGGAIPPNQNMGTVIRENEIGSAILADRIRTGGILASNEDGVLIAENSVTGINNTGLGADAFGISLGSTAIDIGFASSGGVVNANVTRNRIAGVSQDATFSAAGIIVAGGNTPAASPNTISNNMITGVIADSNANDLVAGIFVSGSPGASTRLYHNSVSMTGDRSALLTPGTGQEPSYGIAISGTDPVVELKNNIFYTSQVSEAVANPNALSFGIGMTTTAFTNLDSNFNDFFSIGVRDGGFRTGSLDGGAGTNHADLTAWNTATGDDAAPNSQEVDPVFINPADDLHLNGLTPTPLLGDGLTGFATVDHDNDPRPATAPEIGADELVESTAGLFPVGIFYNAISAPGDQMAGSATVTNALTLNGVLNTGNFNVLTLGCAVATVGNAGGGNYVVGTVNKQYCGTGTFIYPVGTTPDDMSPGYAKMSPEGANPEYTPVTVNVTAGTFPSFLSVRSFDATLVGFDPANSLSRNWELQELGDITANLTFTYLDGTPTDVNGPEASYGIFRRNANGTTDSILCSGLCADTGANTLGPTVSVSDFSRWSGAALAPSAAGVDVSGRVLTPNGAGLRNAIVVMTDSRGVTRSVRSSSFGYYRFDDVRAGETYVISVNSKRFIFTPRTIQVVDEVTGFDMVADGEN